MSVVFGEYWFLLGCVAVAILSVWFFRVCEARGKIKSAQICIKGHTCAICFVQEFCFFYIFENKEYLIIEIWKKSAILKSVTSPSLLCDVSMKGA